MKLGLITDINERVEFLQIALDHFRHGYSLEAPAIAYIGGDPMRIQNPHDPVCDECGKPMRLLF